jgi:ABC-2 type transport system ATP-binding protein
MTRQPPRATTIALDVRGISKRYGTHDALSDVHFSALAGRVHALLGPNGAGKTTLLRIVLGLVRADTGTVQLLGSTSHARGYRLPNAIAGLVDPIGFYPYLTGRQNLALLSRLDEYSTTVADVQRAIERAALGRYADVRVSAYSAGTRQRLGLAAALLRQPVLLLLDEPTASLDPAGSREVRALIRDLATDGAAVVLSSHDLTEVAELCTGVTILNRGRVVFGGDVDRLRHRLSRDVYIMETSDDRAARMAARGHANVTIADTSEGDAMRITAPVDALDRYVLALGRAGIAVRRLQRRPRSLESLFLELTDERGQHAEPANDLPSARGLQ